MKHTVMMRDNRDFKRVYARGRNIVKPQLVLYVMKRGRAGRMRGKQPPPAVNRLGLTAGKKIGSAVCRNRARRLLKEAFRLSEPGISTGFDIVLVARSRILHCGCAEVLRSLSRALSEAGIAAAGEKRPTGPVG